MSSTFCMDYISIEQIKPVEKCVQEEKNVKVFCIFFYLFLWTGLYTFDIANGRLLCVLFYSIMYMYMFASFVNAISAVCETMLIVICIFSAGVKIFFFFLISRCFFFFFCHFIFYFIGWVSLSGVLFHS